MKGLADVFIESLVKAAIVSVEESNKSEQSVFKQAEVNNQNDERKIDELNYGHLNKLTLNFFIDSFTFFKLAGGLQDGDNLRVDETNDSTRHIQQGLSKDVVDAPFVAVLVLVSLENVVSFFHFAVQLLLIL